MQDMTLDELIERLTDLRDRGGVSGDSVVRIAHQPTYPFELSIGHVEAVAVEPPEDEEDPEDEEGPKDVVSVVYIAERAQVGYLSSETAGLFGWR